MCDPFDFPVVVLTLPTVNPGDDDDEDDDEESGNIDPDEDEGIGDDDEEDDEEDPLWADGVAPSLRPDYCAAISLEY